MAALATLLLWWASATYVFAPSQLTSIAIVLAVFATLIGAPASKRYARALGKKDPVSVVIDEVAGQMIAFIGVPLGWKPLLAAFVLFRAFDILKPPPVRQLEALPEGVGIMADDVMAGIYALGVMHLLLYFGVLR